MTVAALIAAGVLSEQVGGAVWMLLPLVVAIVAIGVVPELRWARWRYEVRDEEIDLRHGTVRITRTLVPMLRVQHHAGPARPGARARHRRGSHRGRHDHDPGPRRGPRGPAARPHRRAGPHRR